MWNLSVDRVYKCKGLWCNSCANHEWICFCGVKASTLVVAEHDGGVLKGSSISAIAAASALGEGSTVSVLVGGTGPALQQAASHASKLHPAIDKVLNKALKFCCLQL
jgi:hypothetical protein